MARLEVKWTPAVGAARYEVREQGPGSTPIARFRSGLPLGPRVDSTRFVFTTAELRPYNLSVRSYNRSGVASAEPAEITVDVTLDAQGVRMPSDVDLIMYISMDEKHDQNGDLVEPSLWGTRIHPVGSAERRRRLRWDQGYAENHMIIDSNRTGPFIDIPTGTFTGQLPTSNKRGPSNNHITLGDADDGSVIGRKNLFAQESWLWVDRRQPGGATGGQTDVDLDENFTLIGWVNPVLFWPLGTTASLGLSSETYPIWHRASLVTTSGPNAFRGWGFYMGGPPWFGFGSGIEFNDNVNGFGFFYNKEGATADSFDVAGGGNAIFWSHPWHEPCNARDDGVGNAIGAGEYCGWKFVALTVGVRSGGMCDFTCWVGQADQDDLIKLGTQRQVAIQANLFDPISGEEPPFRSEDIMVSIGQMIDNNVRDDDSDYGNLTTQALFAKYDEMRIYGRALSDAEIRGLYHHPGGQKRTENLVEPERQVLTP